VAKVDWSVERREIERAIFGRRNEGHIDPSNERMLALIDLLGQPQRAYRAIHITGTNGKTSTARMADELLRGFGLRVGRYTSPHLTKVTERIVIDGQPVDDQTFVEAYQQMLPLIEMVDAQGPPLSFFEIVTALGFWIFADTPIDVAVVEVGMGGTWDNTNVLDGEVAVVTPIGLDHTQYLGDSITAIATEKAGIIKPGATAILASQPAEAAAVLLKRAVEVEAAVAREGLEFGAIDRNLAVGGQIVTFQGLGGTYEEVFLPLHGAHQAQNAALALAAVEAFFGVGAASGPLDVDVIRTSFAEVSSPGRLESVRSAPTILVDAAHNPHGTTALVAAMGEAFSFRRLIGVFAAMGD
jgi:dihydrofolate synthase/folylpolyglutamate synthase